MKQDTVKTSNRILDIHPKSPHTNTYKRDHERVKEKPRSRSHSLHGHAHRGRHSCLQFRGSCQCVGSLVSYKVLSLQFPQAFHPACNCLHAPFCCVPYRRRPSGRPSINSPVRTITIEKVVRNSYYRMIQNTKTCVVGWYRSKTPGGAGDTHGTDTSGITQTIHDLPGSDRCARARGV